MPSKCISSLYFIILLFSVVRLHAEFVETTSTETTEYGPITIVMQNLTQYTVNISDETSTELKNKMQRSFADMSGNLEILIANAMTELSNAIYQANQIIAGNSCKPNWNMAQFIGNIHEEFNGCTLNMRTMLDAFRQDANTVVANVQSFVQQIAQLPVICQLWSAIPLNLSFTSGTNCFVQRMANINQNMSIELNRAAVMLVRTRQLTQQSIANVEQCINSVVAQANQNLNELLANCQ